MKITALVAFVIVSSAGLRAQDVPIDGLLANIQLALLDIQGQASKESLPPLDAVTLTLQTEYKKAAGGGIKLFIISFGKKWERTRSHELKLELKPPSPLATRPVSKDAVTEHLVNAVLSAVRGAEAARKRKPPLELNTLTAEFGFVVEEKGSGGLKYELLPVGFDVAGDLSNKAVHKVAVVFKRPEKKK